MSTVIGSPITGSGDTDEIAVDVVLVVTVTAVDVGVALGWKVVSPP